jgi:hypothetical protein
LGQFGQRHIAGGNAGTIFAEDTMGFHRGSDITAGYRLLLQLEFSVIDTPVEEDLKRLIEPVYVPNLKTSTEKIVSSSTGAHLDAGYGRVPDRSLTRRDLPQLDAKRPGPLLLKGRQPPWVFSGRATPPISVAAGDEPSIDHIFTNPPSWSGRG